MMKLHTFASHAEQVIANARKALAVKGRRKPCPSQSRRLLPI
jgi:hypothetical protein